VLTAPPNSDAVFAEVRTESGFTGATRDLIQDFGATDMINLREIDANELRLQNFKFIGTQAFHDLIIVQADVNGDAVADFTIGLKGLKTPNVGDFIL
jgi:hypothetical protein